MLAGQRSIQNTISRFEFFSSIAVTRFAQPEMLSILWTAQPSAGLLVFSPTKQEIRAGIGFPVGRFRK